MLIGIMIQNAELQLDPPVSLEQLVGKGQELPSLPEIYLRVSEQLEDESITVHRIGDTVQHDPAIATRVLKMVNSAYYGLPKQVSSVAQSVSLLGRERLKHILIGSVLRGVFSSGQNNPAFSMQVFWQHCIKTAIIARELAKQIREIEDRQKKGSIIITSQIPVSSFVSYFLSYTFIFTLIFHCPEMEIL